MQKDWVEILEKKYGSIQSPKYSFVFHEAEGKPYRSVSLGLHKRFSVSEDTDLNSDVSFGYLLSTTAGVEFLVRISMVAPFAYISRMRADGTVSTPIVRKSVKDIVELELIELIELQCIHVLDAKTMEIFLPAGHKNAKPLYQWLFVNESDPPWK